MRFGARFRDYVLESLPGLRPFKVLRFEALQLYVLRKHVFKSNFIAFSVIAFLNLRFVRFLFFFSHVSDARFEIRFKTLRFTFCDASALRFIEFRVWYLRFRV